MSILRSPMPNPNLECGTSVVENLNCHYCQDAINSQIQECCIIDICQHIFHRSCIELALANSSQCPLCKETFELSNLRKYPINCVESNEMSTQTGTIKKSRPAYRGKGRGTATNRPMTRNLSRTLLSENLNASNNLDNMKELIEDSTSQIFSNDNNNNIMNFSNAEQNQPIQNAHIRDPNTNKSNEIDYSQLNQIIEKKYN